MQVSNPNNVKIYNLSVGKSLPEWLSERKRRKLRNKDVEIQRRIELIQNFDMPDLSNCVKVSKDGRFILTTGIYKPRVRCYDVEHLSMKFERCFDAEVVKFEILSDDFSKVIFLQNDRYVEFHAKYGKYHRIRIPKFGRDLSYNYQFCDLYVAAAGPEVYRLNLEQGKFLPSFVTNGSAVNVCDINPVHQLFACGTAEGRVECWDPRSNTRCGILDCALSCVTQDTQVNGLPGISALKFNKSLEMAVGTTTGQILLYDIRANKPLLVKDHMFSLPIKDIEFVKAPSQDLVMTMDSKIIKIWDHQSGKLLTSVQPPDTSLNNICLFPNSGLFFVANEDKKILSYYIPTLGPAPKWCSYLDNITEELEESNEVDFYDNYKFITKKEIEEFGATNMIGTNLLRAYMHGFFMDIRLYRKLKSSAEPVSYNEYKKKRLTQIIEEEQKDRVQFNQLPKVNKELAQKFFDFKSAKNKKATEILKDDRFTQLFDNPEYQIDYQSHEFRLLNPVVSKLDKNKEKQIRKQELVDQFKKVDEEQNDEEEAYSESSSDDEHTWTKEVKKQHKLVSQEAKMKRRQEDAEAKLKPQFFELKTTDEFHVQKARMVKAALSLGDRIGRSVDSDNFHKSSGGNRSMTFQMIKPRDEFQEKQEAEHHKERKQLRRSAHSISKRGAAPRGRRKSQH
ncbi:Nucleolar protein 10 [Nymphon striatum]|nr:Nucleolar protein 10 [Nymphon striatum]